MVCGRSACTHCFHPTRALCVRVEQCSALGTGQVSPPVLTRVLSTYVYRRRHAAVDGSHVHHTMRHLGDLGQTWAGLPLLTASGSARVCSLGR
jgi:hypothetical protein